MRRHRMPSIPRWRRLLPSWSGLVGFEAVYWPERSYLILVTSQSDAVASASALPH